MVSHIYRKGNHSVDKMEIFAFSLLGFYLVEFHFKHY